MWLVSYSDNDDRELRRRRSPGAAARRIKRRHDRMAAGAELGARSERRSSPTLVSGETAAARSSRCRHQTRDADTKPMIAGRTVPSQGHHETRHAEYDPKDSKPEQRRCQRNKESAPQPRAVCSPRRRRRRAPINIDPESLGRRAPRRRARCNGPRLCRRVRSSFRSRRRHRDRKSVPEIELPRSGRRTSEEG